MPDTILRPTTRGRLMESALLRFRQRGFHGVGLNEILEGARATKGSLYHFFPGGKTELAVAVVLDVENRLRRMIEAERNTTTAKLVRNVGASVQAWMARTGGDACAFLASFSAEADSEPALRDAVGAAYDRTGRLLEVRLRHDGWTQAQARDRADLVIALLEGGGLLSHARREPRLFTLAIEHAAHMCKLG